MCVPGYHERSLSASMNKYNINMMCWNVEGVMAGTPYLLNCLNTYDIYICGLSEHWLREHHMSFLNTFTSCGYNYIAKPVYEIDPLRYKCNIRGGVAILLKYNTFNYQEIVIDNPRMVGVEIQIPNSQCMYIFAAYMPASSRPNDVFIEHIDLLESLYLCYSGKGKVVIIGDMNVKVEGSRYTFEKCFRSVLFKEFLDRCHLISINVQSSCEGPLFTFYPQTGHCTAIDHIIVQSDMYDLVTHCEVLDDDVINPSEHHPIICTMSIPCSYPGCLNDEMVLKLNWKKSIRNGSIKNYTERLECYLGRIHVPNKDFVDQIEIDRYNDDIVSAMLSASECISKKVFKGHLKPYWKKEMSEMHNEMSQKRITWILNGKPRGDNYYFFGIQTL